MTDVQAARRRLEAAGVRYVFGAYTDLNGVPKSKCVPIGHFEAMAAGSELYTVGALEAAAAMGYTPKMGVEPEVYLLRQVDGQWRPFVASDLDNQPTASWPISSPPGCWSTPGRSRRWSARRSTPTSGCCPAG
jgi:glutamine synthetase